MKNWTRLLAVLVLALVGANVASAQSSPPPNPNYTRFNAKADGDIPTPAANVVYLFFNGTGFRFKDSTATFTNVGGAGITGLNAGRIPQAGSSTTIVDSKMLASGTNSGTWTLYDSTASAVTGVTSLVLREGAAQAASADYTPSLRVFWANGTTETFRVAAEGNTGYTAVMELRYITNTDSYFRLDPNNGLTFRNGGGVSTQGIHWNDTTYAAIDLSLLRGGASILNVTDGSTGWGSVRAGNLGVQTANGAISNLRTISEEINIAGSASTDSAADLLPANSIILSVTARITTTITTATDWNLQDPTTANRFLSPVSTLTAGTQAVGLNHMQGGVASNAAGPVQTTAAKLRIVTTGTPGVGAIRVTVTYLLLTPPSS